jgi:sugar lactone lactonase YvrE
MYVADYTGTTAARGSGDAEGVAHDDRMNQPNDLAIGPDGTLYASDPNWKEGTGRLWRIDRDGRTGAWRRAWAPPAGSRSARMDRRLYVNESVQRKRLGVRPHP